MIFFLPLHLCRLLGIKLKTYLYRAFVWPLVLCVPLVAVLLLMRRWFIPHRLHELLIQLGIAGLIYAIGLSWTFWTRRAWDVGTLGGNPEDEVTLALVERYEEQV
jgi:hypothetical protein